MRLNVPSKFRNNLYIRLVGAAIRFVGTVHFFQSCEQHSNVFYRLKHRHKYRTNGLDFYYTWAGFRFYRKCLVLAVSAELFSNAVSFMDYVSSVVEVIFKLSECCLTILTGNFN